MDTSVFLSKRQLSDQTLAEVVIYQPTVRDDTNMD